jgi:hypothetical protein
MKSPMVESASYISDKGNYSEMQVLRSAAGFYVGTIYNHPDGFQEPGSRDSGYFPTFDKAQEYLDEINETGDTSGLRMNP